MTNSRDISFATFNLYNLQLPGKRWRFNAEPYSEQMYRQKVTWSAEMIHRIQADVIAFQELWSKQCLIDIFVEAGLENDYELVFIKDEWYDIAVAAAVRSPWTVRQKTIHKEFPEELTLIKRGNDPQDAGEDNDIEVKINIFSRSVLQLSIGHTDDPDVPQIEAFATHLKSKLPTRLDNEESDDEGIRSHSQALGSALSTIRRTAEVAALRIIVNKVAKHTDVPVVIVGDLNDGQLSNTLAIATQQPSYRLYGASRVGGKSDVGLYDASTLQQFRSLRDVYYTHVYKDVREIIDHVLVSEQFYHYSRQRIWSFREMKVWNDFLDDEHKWTSDHGIVCAYFDYGPNRD
ncbi:MAG: endonuclease/exonuclease/phosphatase family protein [Leptolyngbyaceae bacterium]|nr:endonuclease/exonuclease/phosphatase family protein [Leptolyngbyaceae bacterium]